MEENNVPTKEKAVGVVVTNSKADGSLTYDAVRAAWKFSEGQLEKANQARYVVAIENGVVVDIFEKHGEFRPSVENPQRFIFSPVPVCDLAVRRAYIGKRYRSYGAAVIFFGYNDKEN